MKKFLIALFFLSSVCFAQQLPRDSVYIGTTPQGVGGGGPFQLTNSYSNIQILTPAAAIVVKMPTGTVVKKGSKWRIVNQSTTAANTVSIQASDATDIYASMQYGYVEMVAKQDNPTTYSHWLKTDVSDEGSLSFTTKSSPDASPWAAAKTVAVNYYRKGQMVTLDFDRLMAAGNNVASKIIFPDGTLPTRLRCWMGTKSAVPPTANGAIMVSQAVVQSERGFLMTWCVGSGSDGRIEVARDTAGNTFQSSSTVGFETFTVTYLTNQ